MSESGQDGSSVMPWLVADPREQTTAATDLALAVAALVAIQRLRVGTGWRARIWRAAFGLLAVSGLLGAAIHGIRWSTTTREQLWVPLNGCLGLIIALFATGAIGDRWGEAAARRVFPALALIVPLFVWLSHRLRRGFLIFILYELSAMLLALALYVDLARQQRLPGSAQMTIGILITMIAAAIQTSSLEYTVAGVPFDHNGLFHLVQLAALPFLVEGARAGFGKDTQR